MKQSGVMVLGWYLCHPVCRHRRAQPPELEQLKSRARLPHQHTEYMSLFGILSSFALAQPLNILPKRVVEHVPLSRRLSVPRAVQQQSSTISVDVTDSTEDSASEQPKFGPITAEEVGLNKMIKPENAGFRVFTAVEIQGLLDCDAM